MEKGLEQLIAGIAWLAEGGRENAKKFGAAHDDDGNIAAELDEAIEWLGMVNRSEEIA